MITKKDIERVFSRHPNMKPPDQIYLLSAPVVAQVDGHALLKGSRPVGENIAFLTPQGNDETILHETLHCYGFREFGAELGGKLLTRLRKIIPPFRKKEVQFQVEKVPFSEVEQYGFRVGSGERPDTVTLLKKKKL